MLPFNRSRLAVIAIGAIVVLPTALAQATSSITPKTTGIYSSSAKAAKSVRFSVAKHRVTNFQMECFVGPKSFGSYYLIAGPAISASGTFTYKGTIAVYRVGARVGSATLKLTGRFTSSTRATGSAAISHAVPALPGCPSSTFTVRYSSSPAG